MEIRMIRPGRIKKCSTKRCDKKAHFTVFSKGVPRNFFRFCCKNCVTDYETIQKEMRS